MKKMLIFGLALMVVMTFSFAVMAAEPAPGDDYFYLRTGTDPVVEDYDAGWLIDAGSLVGWTDSNFETLTQQESGLSDIVGEGVTVVGTNVFWDHPRKGFNANSIPVPIPDDFDQTINYTVNAYAEIPCYLEMNIFGNGGWMKAKSIGMGATTEVTAVADHYMLFHTNYGGVLDDDWNFVPQSNDTFSSFGVREGLYIHACDLWTANLFANVPYGFSVASEGLGEDFELPIHMRYVIQDIDAEVFPGDAEFSAGEVLTGAGNVIITDAAAMETNQVNMQFKVPYAQVDAGVYEGEVLFSMYSL